MSRWIVAHPVRWYASWVVVGVVLLPFMPWAIVELASTLAAPFFLLLAIIHRMAWVRVKNRRDRQVRADAGMMQVQMAGPGIPEAVVDLVGPLSLRPGEVWRAELRRSRRGVEVWSGQPIARVGWVNPRWGGYGQAMEATWRQVVGTAIRRTPDGTVMVRLPDVRALY